MESYVRSAKLAQMELMEQVCGGGGVAGNLPPGLTSSFQTQSAIRIRNGSLLL
ncbi:hypothetical protein RvY_08120 [Ramazzottius varieornatus]|uniref:Uncharacterized protein n=1 Tax=Ramazzottius varieornatus TaxID=947166 RepID=A0A1D1V7G6_RAMVA|nr:hypothetical protein RvY_08120 [Ramazzottius varieornatus]